MAISTADQYIAAAKQRIPWVKTASRTTVALNAFSMFDLAGSPGAGVLAGTSTANGVVPTAATAGAPLINAFGGGAVGYLSGVEISSTVVSRVNIYDLVFKAGAYAFTAGTTALSAQPSFASRMPGANYGGTEIWVQVSTAFVTGTSWQVQVTYTNQAGVAGRTTVVSAAAAAAALSLGKEFLLALQAGDSGVQKIESVIVTNGGTAMTAGAFNVLVRRRLLSTRIATANGTTKLDLFGTGMPVVHSDSCIDVQIIADSTSTGLPDINLEIANG